jgi:hypothetical protein
MACDMIGICGSTGTQKNAMTNDQLQPLLKRDTCEMKKAADDTNKTTNK